MNKAQHHNEALYSTAYKAAVEAGNAILEVYHGDDFQVTEKEDNSPLTKADRAAHHVITRYLEQTGIPVLSEEGRDIPFAERSGWERFWLVDPLDGTKEFIKRNGEFTVNIALIESGVPVYGVVYTPVLEKLYAGIPGEGAWMVDIPGTVHQVNESANRKVHEKADPGDESKAPGRILEKRSYDGLTIESVRRSGTPLPVEDISEAANSAFRVVASRSHLNADTEQFLEQIRADKRTTEIVSKGSSLKLCMVATGEADMYPRLGPTMEWDVAAAHAVVSGAGKQVLRLKKAGNGGEKEGKEAVTWHTDGELRYNKENLLNPYFLVT